MSTKQTELVIEAQLRQTTGKEYAKKLRKAGKIPAVLNDKGKATSIELDPKLLSKAWLNNEKKFHLSLGGDKRLVEIKELQIDPVKRFALHVDLAYVQ